MGTVIAKDEDGKARIVLTDREPTTYPAITPINLPMDVLFPPGRRIERTAERVTRTFPTFDAATSLKKAYSVSSLGEMISQATKLVFSLPAV